MNKEKEGAIVYSSELGRICPRCHQPITRCQCQKKKPVLRGDGIVRVGRETQGRKGKGVTVITGLPLTLEGIHDLARQLKQKCGSGGTVKEGVIEIQGDHRDLIVEELQKQGFSVKRSGG